MELSWVTAIDNYASYTSELSQAVRKSVRESAQKSKLTQSTLDNLLTERLLPTIIANYPNRTQNLKADWLSKGNWSQSLSDFLLSCTAEDIEFIVEKLKPKKAKRLLNPISFFFHIFRGILHSVFPGLRTDILNQTYGLNLDRNITDEESREIEIGIILSALDWGIDRGAVENC